MSNRWQDEENREWVTSENQGPYNLLRRIPDEILKLKKLQFLRIGGSGYLVQFRMLLFIDEWGIIDISVLQGLTNLQSLSLQSTQVEDISVLQGLTNLQSLSLQSTQVEDISPLLPLIRKGIKADLKEYASGQGIHLYECPLQTPPPEVVEQGNDAILRYFEQLEQEGVDYIYEAKMLIVGKGGSGKTSLATKLRDPEAELPTTDVTTRGIEIEPLYFDHGPERFRMNIWDFGGQEIYKHTHQFFLTKRSLYVLVDDTRQSDQFREDQKAFNDWLQTVELFGQGSPLLIVQNEVSDRSKDIPLDEMRGQYEVIKDCFQANLKTNRGLEDIRRAIEYHVCGLPHVGDAVPKPWVKVREDVAELAQQQPYISDQDFWDLCAEHGIEDTLKQQDLSEYFHDLGVFLHFQEEVKLRQTVVLRNEWVTDAVYKVIDNETVKKNHGRFTLAQAYDIWHQDTYRGKQPELLALMEKFELCYRIPDQRPESYLVPQLLPVSRPKDHKWDPSDNLQLRYRYEFMPKGLISRFMVRMHRYIRELTQAWKSGVVLYNDDQVAEVIEEFGDDQMIYVRVRGPRRRDFLAVIREQFDRLHDSYGGIKVQMQIPCNCEECEGSKEPHFYSEKVISRAIEKRQPTLQCQLSFEAVNVRGLLDDLDMAEGDFRPGEEPRPRRSTEEQALDMAEKVIDHQKPK